MIRFRYFHGVRYVAPWRPAPPTFARCGTCGRAWDDSKPTAWTPAPSARCPFEYWHTDAERAACDGSPQCRCAACNQIRKKG